MEKVETPANRLTVWNHEVEMIQSIALLGVENSGHHPVNGQSGAGTPTTGFSSVYCWIMTRA